MPSNSISIALAAADGFSKPFNNASKSVGALQEKVSITSKTLKSFEKDTSMLTRFKSLSTQLDATKAKMAGAKDQISLYTQSQIEAKKALKQHTKAEKEARQAVLEASSAYGAHSFDVEEAKIKLASLTKVKEKAERQVKKETVALKQATIAQGRLSGSFAKQSKELGGLKNDLKSAGINLKAINVEERLLAKHTKLANKALDQQKLKLKKIQTLESRIAGRKAQRGELAGQAVNLGAKMLPLAYAGKKAVDYESTFADVKKVVNFKNDNEANNYKKQMLVLGGELGVSPEGIAEIVTAAGQSGIEKTELLQFAKSATKMSVAWDVSSQEAGETLATWRAAMGLTQENALDLADSTNYLSNNMNAKAKDIAAVMVRQGSTAMGAGFSSNQSAALSASLLAGGATNETAATALKNISGRLTTGYAATGAQKEAFGKIGFDAEELASSMQEDAQGTLVSVMRALQNVSADERGAVISQMFGEEVKGAVSKLVTTLDDPKNGLISSFGRVEKAIDRENSVNDEYANRAKTRSHTLGQLNAKFSRMMITLGDRLLPVIDLVVPPLMTVVDLISTFAQESPKLATGLMGVVAGIGLLKAGAIAFKLAKLTLSDGRDKFKLGKTKLSGTTDVTALSANRASKALNKVNRELSGLANNGGSSAGNGAAWGNKKSKRKKRRFPRRAGKFGKIAGLLSSGAALSMFSGSSNASNMAMAGADVAGTIGGLTSLLPAGGALLKGAGKLFRPLDMLLSGVGVASAMQNGDSKQIGGSVGDLAGGMGGAAAGAAIGTILLPGIGTVVGSIIGSMGGGELGGWLGESISGWFSEDKTKQSPSSDIANQTKQLNGNNKQISFSPTIHFTPTGDREYDQKGAQGIMDMLKAEFTPMFLGDGLSIRSDASLADGVHS